MEQQSAVYSANYPDILMADINTNPRLLSPNSDYCISFKMTPEDKYDFEEYEAIIKSAVHNFRTSVRYKHYKSYLHNLGLDRCYFHPYIQSTPEFEMASLEMHHCMLTIFDITVIIAEHLLNSGISFSEYQLTELLKQEHSANRVPITMLCKTCHQQYHHKYLYVHPEGIFGKWWELLERYPLGWNRDIMEKVMRYLNKAVGEKFQYRVEDMKKLLELRDAVADWSGTRGVKLDGC
jgi:hypothetical protein